MAASASEILKQLAPEGRLRAAINFGNPILARRGATGEPTGVSVTLATDLAGRLGVPVEFVTFEGAGKVFEAAGSNIWDIAFLAVDPVRAAQILFTAPYLAIEAACMVRHASPFARFADLDRPGVRIAVGKGAAYELHLRRTVKHATLVSADTSKAAVDLFSHSDLDAVAGVRNPLLERATTEPQFRVLDEALVEIRQAVGTPLGRLEAIRFLDGYLAELKASGFLAATLARDGQTDAVIV